MPYKYSLYNEFHVRWIGHGKAHIEGRIYSMSISCVAPHAQGKSAKDRIFGASEAAQNRIKEIGADKVTNSTIGVMLDNDGNFVVLPTVAKVYHSYRTPGIPGSCPGCLFWPVPSGWLLHGCSCNRWRQRCRPSLHLELHDAW